MSINEEDVKTFGLGQQQTEGNATTGIKEDMVPTPNSALSSTDQPASTLRTPANENATVSPDGGAEPTAEPDPLLTDRGNPGDAPKKLGGAAVDVGGQVLKNIKKIRAESDPLKKRQISGQAAQLEEILEANGGNVQKAWAELNKQVEKGIEIEGIENDIPPGKVEKKKLAWRNIYNTIAPEEMSLFLIDFGMRAMMAGESMGSLGAIGAAGQGALGALQGRREAAEAKNVEDYKYGLERGDAERQFGLDERRTKAAEDQAAAALKRVERGYTGRDPWREQYFEARGYDEEERARLVAGGEEISKMISDEVRQLKDDRQAAILAEKGTGGIMDDSMRRKLPMPDGTFIPLSEITDDQIRVLAKEGVNAILEDAREIRKSGGALPPTTNKKDADDYYDETG